MSLFGSLYTSVAGLDAQSQATAIISNNIANVNTTGFKRSEATFAALVTVESAAARYSPGGVAMNRLQQVNQQGQIAQSSSTTDVAISGNGFLVVRDQEEVDQVGDFYYTRNGQFIENENGILINTAGKYLYGWEIDPADQDPNFPPTNTNFNPDLSALVPINVALATGQSQTTSEASLGINLNADEDGVGVDPATGLAVSTAPTDFARTLRMYDSLGSAQDVIFQFTKTHGPTAYAEFTSSDLEVDTDLSLIPGIGIGDQIEIEIPGNPDGPVQYPAAGITAGYTVGQLLAEINTYGTGGGAQALNAFLNDNGQIVITAVNPTTYDPVGMVTTPGDDILISDFGAGTATTVLGLVGAPPYTAPAALPPSNTDGTFPELLNQPGAGQYNPGGWWQVDIIGPDPTTPLAQGFLNFNSDGSINAAIDPVDGRVSIDLVGVDWGNFSDLQNIDIDISGMSQFADFYNVAYANQNGSELGLKSSIEIDDEGYVNARFSNGKISRLYKLPIATFPSATNLQEISGTAYSESADSGVVLLQEAGTAGAGTLAMSTLELSNVDLAEEFSKLIVTQRAYSANTRVINTVDQMTEDLLRLR